MRDKINDVERYAVKAKGRNELLNYFRGKPLTYKQAILGHCDAGFAGSAPGNILRETRTTGRIAIM